MQVGPSDFNPFSGEMPQESPISPTKKRKLPIPSTSGVSKNKKLLSKKVKQEKEASIKSFDVGQQGLFLRGKGKEKEKVKKKDEDAVVRKLNLGELGMVNLTEEQEHALVSSSDFFRMIFSQGLSANELEVDVNLTGEEHSLIHDKLLKLIHLASHQKPYSEYTTFVELEKVEKEKGNTLDVEEAFNDFIAMREAAIYLGMNSYIQEANKLCLEMISTNSNSEQKIKQLAQVISYGKFTSEEYGSIYELSLKWNDLMKIHTFPSAFRSEAVNSIFEFLKMNAQKNPTTEHTLDNSLSFPDFKTQISQMLDFCPNIRKLKIISPEDFDEDKALVLFNGDHFDHFIGLKIEKLVLDFAYQDVYSPKKIKKLFPHLLELHMVDTFHELNRSIIRHEIYNNFVNLQKIYLYECLEHEPCTMYERSPETKKFVNPSPDVDSESSEFETESSESERDD
ncbi:MAG: hypothetical protein CK425_07585 [Parachlamydia sp.]|nr:MAG: hypothetical protein CK425_07585 [Parachlamydia sp.]